LSLPTTHQVVEDRGLQASRFALIRA